MSMRRTIVEQLAALTATVDGYAKDTNRRLDAAERRLDRLDARTMPKGPTPWWQPAGGIAAGLALFLSVADRLWK